MKIPKPHLDPSMPFTDRLMLTELYHLAVEARKDGKVIKAARAVKALEAAERLAREALA